MSSNSTNFKPTAANFARAARSQIGVPFAPQGRSAFNLLDCVGLPVVSAAIIGVELEFVSDYSFGSDYSGMLGEYLAANGREVSMSEMQEGDVVAFWLTKPNKPRHLAVLSSGAHGFDMIHTSESSRRVVQHELDAKWQRHIHSVWRFYGID